MVAGPNGRAAWRVAGWNCGPSAASERQVVEKQGPAAGGMAIPLSLAYGARLIVE